MTIADVPCRVVKTYEEMTQPGDVLYCKEIA